MNSEQYSSVKIDNMFEYKTSKVRFLKKSTQVADSNAYSSTYLLQIQTLYQSSRFEET